MSDFLPVCLQDFLYSRKPELRAQIRAALCEMVSSGFFNPLLILMFCIRSECLPRQSSRFIKVRKGY